MCLLLFVSGVPLQEKQASVLPDFSPIPRAWCLLLTCLLLFVHGSPVQVERGGAPFHFMTALAESAPPAQQNSTLPYEIGQRVRLASQRQCLQAKERWGNEEAYQQYRRSTFLLFPIPKWVKAQHHAVICVSCPSVLVLSISCRTARPPCGC